MKSPIGTILDLHYGKAEIIGFNGTWRREIYRPNEVHPSEPWNKEVHERVMIEDHQDASTRHNKMTYGKGAGYDARCACCWLNISHSERKHAASVASVVATHAARAVKLVQS